MRKPNADDAKAEKGSAMIISVTARSSFGGSVFAIAQTAVYPPATAARVPVAIVYNLFLDRFIAGITGGAVKG